MIFVFGSNESGRHGAGAARTAMLEHGAVYGRSVGHHGNSYAIPTKDLNIDALHLQDIWLYVSEFLEYAEANPELEFKVTAIGCGLAGYVPEQIAPMFHSAPNNCWMPPEFKPVFDELFEHKTFKYWETEAFKGYSK